MCLKLLEEGLDLAFLSPAVAENISDSCIAIFRSRPESPRLIDARAALAL